MRKIITSVIALVLVATTLFGLVGCGEKKEELTGQTATVWTNSSVLSFAKYSYFLNSFFRQFVSNYSADYLSAYGLDTTKDLTEQTYDKDSGTTWYSYISYKAYSEIVEMLAVYDKALEEGYVLSEEGYNSIDETIDLYKEQAKDYGVTYEEYVTAMFSDVVTPDDVRECLIIQTITSEFYADYYKAKEYSDEDYENYFKENQKTYLHYDYMGIVVPSDDAEAFEGVSTVEDFNRLARETITKNNFDGDYESNAAKIDELVEAKTRKRCGYSEGSEFCEWVYEEGRKPYDVYTSTNEETGKTTVSMILPVENGYTDVLYRDENPVRNFYYVLFEDETEALEVYNKWVSDGASKEEFESLIKEKDGGTIKNADKGDFTGNLADWAFDKANTEGSYSTVTVDGTGTYLVYMLEDGEASWLVDVKTAKSNSDYQDSLTKLTEADPSTYDEDVIYNAKIMTFSTSKTEG